MDILTEVTAFVDLARTRGQLAATTFKGWRWHLRKYGEWMAVHGNEEPTPETVAAFADYLQTPKEQGGRGFAPRSTRTAWVALRAWDEYLLEEKRVSASIIPARYPLPKLQETPIVSCPASEQRAIAAAAVACKLATPFRSALARACFFVLATCAVRNSALRNLRIDDYNHEGRTLQLTRAKNGKTSEKNLSAECLEAIEAWMEVRPKDTEHDYLFCQNDRKRKLGDTGLKALLRELSHAAGLEYRREHRPHAQRRGTARRLVQEGAHIEVIRELLDHSKLTTTQIYTRLTTEDLRAYRDKFPLLKQEAAEAEPAAQDSQAAAELVAMREQMALMQETMQALLAKQPDTAAQSESELAILRKCLEALLSQRAVTTADAPPPAAPPARRLRMRTFGRKGSNSD